MKPRAEPMVRAQGLDAGRGVAAVMVVVFHALLVFELDGVEDGFRLPLGEGGAATLAQGVLLTLFNGPACVTFFFVLSGTVLALSLGREARPGAASLLGYLVKRGFRLYPLLVLCAGLGALLQLLQPAPERFALATSWLNDSYRVAPEELAREFVANATGRSATLNGPAWSIKVELLASAAFPLLFLLARRPGPAAAAGLLLLGGMFLLPGERLHHMNVFLPCFFVGALIPLHGGDLARRLSAAPRPLRLLAAGAAALALLATRRVVAPDEFVVPGVVLVETAGAALLIALLLFGPDRPLFHRRPMRVLAEISYGVYLLHCILLLALARAVLPALPDRLGGAEALAAGLLLAVATLAVTLPLAWLLHHGCERPMQRLGHRLATLLARRDRRGVPAGGRLAPR